MNTTKLSIRFFNNREVRAVWKEQKMKRWFSVIDIFGILQQRNNQLVGGINQN